MPTRGERLQAIFDMAHAAVRVDPDIKSLRDLHGAAWQPDGRSQDPIATVLGGLWAAHQDAIGPILDELRCQGCPMCNGEVPPGQPKARCAFASFDAVEAFKDGARAAVIERMLAKPRRSEMVYGGRG